MAWETTDSALSRSRSSSCWIDSFSMSRNLRRVWRRRSRTSFSASLSCSCTSALSSASWAGSMTVPSLTGATAKPCWVLAMANPLPSAALRRSSNTPACRCSTVIFSAIRSRS